MTTEQKQAPVFIACLLVGLIPFGYAMAHFEGWRFWIAIAYLLSGGVCIFAANSDKRGPLAKAALNGYGFPAVLVSMGLGALLA